MGCRCYCYCWLISRHYRNLVRVTAKTRTALQTVFYVCVRFCVCINAKINHTWKRKWRMETFWVVRSEFNWNSSDASCTFYETFLPQCCLVQIVILKFNALPIYGSIFINSWIFWKKRHNFQLWYCYSSIIVAEKNNQRIAVILLQLICLYTSSASSCICNTYLEQQTSK